VGDEAEIGDFHAQVLEVDGMRISRVLLVRHALEPGEDEGGLEEAGSGEGPGESDG
jgi:hypothetical protein